VFVIEAGVYRIAPTTILVKDLPTVIVAWQEKYSFQS
jgi:hypothetical protein